MKPINVALLGIGTVGGGTFTVLSRNQDEIARRAGRPIKISVVADKDVERAKHITRGQSRVTDDAFAEETIARSNPALYTFMNKDEVLAMAADAKRMSPISTGVCRFAARK